jgi:23S rRNA pseudouridine2604 synthase
MGELGVELHPPEEYGYDELLKQASRSSGSGSTSACGPHVRGDRERAHAVVVSARARRPPPYPGFPAAPGPRALRGSPAGEERCRAGRNSPRPACGRRSDGGGGARSPCTGEPARRAAVRAHQAGARPGRLRARLPARDRDRRARTADGDRARSRLRADRSGRARRHRPGAPRPRDRPLRRRDQDVRRRRGPRGARRVARALQGRTASRWRTASTTSSDMVSGWTHTSGRCSAT